MKANLLTLAILSLGVTGQVATAQTPPPATTAPAPMVDKDTRMKAYNDERATLERQLAVGQNRAAYRAALEKAGYWITAINREADGAIEYEVVKGDNSYEVQVEMKDGMGSKVSVTPNVWKSEQTRRALSDSNYKYAYPTAVSKDAATARDVDRNKAFADEKQRLEASLGVGKNREYYRGAVEKMGYKVASVNDASSDSVEYEIVKGDTSYELQVDFDPATRMSKKVDVSTNLWDAPGTDRAKAGR